VVSSDWNEVNKVSVVVKDTLVELLDDEHFDEIILRTYFLCTLIQICLRSKYCHTRK
jgi:hypothetical protein